VAADDSESSLGNCKWCWNHTVHTTVRVNFIPVNISTCMPQFNGWFAQEVSSEDHVKP
jgi:hypothetical protein